MGDLNNFGDQGSDRFIANEIETIYNSTIMHSVAEAVVDSFKVKKISDDLSLVLNKDYFQSKGTPLKSVDEFEGDLLDNVKITQKNDLDFIQISAKSPSPFEAALIANTFAKKYQEYNLAENRKQITVIKEFLGEQLKEKQQDLSDAEDAIKAYQLKKGGVELDQQAQLLVNKLSDFESESNRVKIDMSVSKEKLNQYKSEIEEKDPSIYNFLSNKSTEPYLENLQKQIADLETQRDFALASSKTAQAKEQIVNDFNAKINSLKDKLNSSIVKYRDLILSSSPQEIKDLTQKAFEEQVKYRSLNASNTSLSSVINDYEEKFNLLPATTLEFARLERKRQYEENIFKTLSEKYQEAQLNEQSTLGNILVLNTADLPDSPSEPNRIKIIIMGLFLGIGFALGFVYIRNYFNKAIKTPDDIGELGTTLLTWIPRAKKNIGDPSLIVFNNSDFATIESFRALRTRIQFSKSKSDAKSILITSSAPGEGKTMVAINLASSFARDDKRTIIIDCDLRKPRLHSIMGDSITPGVSDYLFGRTTKENIIRTSKLTKLDYVTAGTIQSNSSEVLNSIKTATLFQKFREDYDIVIIDSAPILAVADTEVLSNFVDASILVVSANTTELEWAKQSINLLSHKQNTLLGVVLNNYDFKFGYPSNYKYYDYYYSTDESNKKKQSRKHRNNS